MDVVTGSGVVQLLSVVMTAVIPVVTVHGDVLHISLFCPLPGNRILLEGDGVVSR